MMTKQKNRYWSKSDKLKIVIEVISKENRPSEVAKKYDISSGLLSTWTTKYILDGEEALENTKKPGNPLAKYQNRKELTPIEQLEYENMKLKIEVERLKKRLHSERSWEKQGIRYYKQQEFKIIEELISQYNVKFLCESMNINRSSYVKWFKHKDTKNQYQAYRDDIYPLIQECHEKHNSYGYHMIAAYIRDHSDWNGGLDNGASVASF